MYDAVFAEGFIRSIYKAKSSDSIVSSMEKNKKAIDKYITEIFEMASEMQ